MSGPMKVIYKAIKTKIAMDKLALAKINAARERKGLPPLRTWYQHCAIGCSNLCRENCVRPYCPCCLLDLRGLLRERISRTRLGRMFQDGTYENDILKAWIGFLGGVVLSYLWFLMLISHSVILSMQVFLGGVLLSYLWFLMLVYQLHFQALASFFFALGLGIVLPIGLAFSKGVRCLTFLALPSLCSSKGRSALLAFGFVLVLAGPMQNFAHNVEVMSASASCGQEMAYNVTKDVVDTALAPAKAMLEEIRATIAEIMYFVEKLREAFLKLRRLYMEIFAAIRRVFSWLGNMVNICNDSMGTPYTKCISAFNKAETDCRAKMGILKGLCKIVKGISYLCHVARVGEVLCKAVESIKHFVSSKIKSRMSLAIQNVYDMFYFNVSLVYHYDIEIEQSRTYDEVMEDIRREVLGRLHFLRTIMGWGQWVLFGLLFWVIIKTILYRHKFLTKDSFDNFYITAYVRHLNERRREMKKETILPLEFKEQWQYIYTGSIRMSIKECIKLALGLLMFFGTFLHAVFYLVLDYGLYWILHTVRVHGEVRTHQPSPGRVKMHVQGSGVLADMYRSVISRMDPEERLNMDVDTTQCLPNASEPDYKEYKLIFTIYGICLLMTIVEAYGLRVRHVVAGCYYPQRAKERAIWLCNHILRKRCNFLKLLRRQMRKNAMDQREEEEAGKISIWAKLGTEIPLLGKILKWFGMKYKYCLACGVVGKPDDMDAFVHCANHGCNGVYCRDCFTDINNLCTVCMNPIDYGDYSDFSEERDSSDEEVMGGGKMSGKVQLKPEDYAYQFKKNLNLGSEDSSDEDELSQRASVEKRTEKKDLVSMDYFEGFSDSDESDSDDYDDSDSEDQNDENTLLNQDTPVTPQVWYDPGTYDPNNPYHVVSTQPYTQYYSQPDYNQQPHMYQ